MVGKQKAMPGPVHRTLPITVGVGVEGTVQLMDRITVEKVGEAGVMVPQELTAATGLPVEAPGHKPMQVPHMELQTSPKYAWAVEAEEGTTMRMPILALLGPAGTAAASL
jgi:hypothetical protein